MKKDLIKGYRKETLGSVLELLVKHCDQDPVVTSARRAKFMLLMKARYGYTNEESLDEMNRLLTRFHKTNRLIGAYRSHHSRLNIRHVDAGLPENRLE
jgi:hypothetical protein